ncbi:MAG: class I tRNA ligase family protein, partial [Thermoplasmata archaeon]|nr:class I tRNA ligase family protein [Thermoplasmata archaeon]
VARFTLQVLPADAQPPDHAPELTGDSRLEDRWLLSRWSRTQEEIDAALAEFEFTRMATTLHGFLWHDVADRYVELAKETLQGKNGVEPARLSREVLLFVLERSIRALHPISPHVTEELWHALPHRGDSLTTAAWPKASEAPRDPEAEVAMDVVLESIRVYRNLRSENKVPVENLPVAWVRPTGGEVARLIDQERPTILRLARVQGVSFLAEGASAPPGVASTVTTHGEYFIALPAESRAAETEALKREREKLSLLLEKTRARLADAGFTARAPPDVVREAEQKAAELAERVERIDEHLGRPTAPEESA